MDGTQRGKAESEHYSVGASDANRSGKVVNTGREEQIPATSKLSIDGVRSVDAGPRDIEPADRDGSTRCFAALPSDPGTVGAQRRNANA